MTMTLNPKIFCKSSGADLVGIADLGPFKKGWTVVPQDLLTRYTHAISIAKRLDDKIMNRIVDGPTADYAQHYRDINASLDAIASHVVGWINERGFNAKAIPASHIVDESRLLGNISHKAVARMAGLGWQGKSLLIISPEFGPRIRLVTVLTDMPLMPDKPIKNRCGKCVECVKACPASAIKNVRTESRYESRDEAIHLEKCHAKVKEFEALPGIGARICGICVKVCPFGKKSTRRGGSPHHDG